MIAFFRKIRQQVLTQNKLPGYLFYAIGEIVLVVIGILIALQINNWNEAQKGLEIEKQRYQNLITDLKSDQMISELILKQDLHYDFYEVSQNGKTPDSSKILAGVNMAPELQLVAGKNQLTELEYIKDLQIRKEVNDYITHENAAIDDAKRLENYIKNRVRIYFQEINATQIEDIFVPGRYDNKEIRVSFEYDILAPHFKDTDFKGILINLRMQTVNSLYTLRNLKEKTKLYKIF